MADVPVVQIATMDELRAAARPPDDDWGDDFGDFEEQQPKAASRRSAQAARHASGGAPKPKSGGTRHAPITVPLPRAWKTLPDGKFQKYKQPSNLLAKGWRLWPDDKIEKVGQPQAERPSAPDLFDSQLLSKDPDENLAAAAPTERLDKVELTAKVFERRMQRSVVLHTLGYFISETIERPNAERMAAVNANLANVFGEGIAWNAKQVVAHCTAHRVSPHTPCTAHTAPHAHRAGDYMGGAGARPRRQRASLLRAEDQRLPAQQRAHCRRSYAEPHRQRR